MIIHYGWNLPASAQGSSKQICLIIFKVLWKTRGQTWSKGMPGSSWICSEAPGCTKHCMRDKSRPECQRQNLSEAMQKWKCVWGGEIKKHKEEKEQARTQGQIYGKKCHSQCKTNLVLVGLRQFSMCKSFKHRMVGEQLEVTAELEQQLLGSSYHSKSP